MNGAPERIAQARSFLFVPGSRPDRFARAAASGADTVILDLEDAVAASDKATARKAVSEWLSDCPAVVRINAADTPWHQDDVASLATAAQLDGIMVAKSDSARELRALAARLPRIPLIALVESAKGVRDAPEIAQVDAVARLAFGSFDFCLDAGVTPSSADERELLSARSAIVLASRAAGLPGPVDGVHADIGDETGLTAATRRAADLGFTGKLCVNPRQIPRVHAALQPEDARLAWAARVVEGAGASDGAAIKIDGEMIDKPILELARRLLSLAGRHGSGGLDVRTEEAPRPSAVDGEA